MTRTRLALSRALLLGTTLACGAPGSSSTERTSPELGADTTDAGGEREVADASIADSGTGGSDAGLVRLYCWLITDPRCFADGGTAPGTIDAC